MPVNTSLHPFALHSCCSKHGILYTSTRPADRPTNSDMFWQDDGDKQGVPWKKLELVKGPFFISLYLAVARLVGFTIRIVEETLDCPGFTEDVSRVDQSKVFLCKFTSFCGVRKDGPEGIFC